MTRLVLAVVLVLALVAPGLAAPPTTALGGDLSGTPATATVTKVRGRTMSATAPTLNQVWSWDGSQWAPATVAVGTWTGNLLGATISNTATVSPSYGVVIIDDPQGMALRGATGNVSMTSDSSNNLVITGGGIQMTPSLTVGLTPVKVDATWTPISVAAEQLVHITSSLGNTGSGNKYGMFIDLSGYGVSSGLGIGLHINQAMAVRGDAPLINTESGSFEGNMGVFSYASGHQNSFTSAGYFTASVGASGTGRAYALVGRGFGSGPESIGVFAFSDDASTTYSALHAAVAITGEPLETTAVIVGEKPAAVDIALLDLFEGSTRRFRVGDGGEVTSQTDLGIRLTNAAGTEGVRWYPIRVQTTDAATTYMTIDDAGSTYLPALADGDCYSYRAEVVGYGVSGTEDNLCSTFDLNWAVKRIGATTSLVAAPTTQTPANEGAWSISADADDTNDRTRIFVNGDAATTINWRGWVRVMKVN